MDSQRPNQVRVERLEREIFLPEREGPKLVSFLRGIQIPLLALLAACAMIGGIVSDEEKGGRPATHRFVGVEPAPGPASSQGNAQDLSH